jgi:short subunit dehydrogenase-like uncharacterized protein
MASGYGIFGGRTVERLEYNLRLTIVVAQRSQARPNILIDASGPFQAYGKKPHVLIEAAIAQSVEYLDLADGTEFIAGLAQFDEAARKAKVLLLRGVSSFPVLTAAAVRR